MEKNHNRFLGISNEAFGLALTAVLRDAAELKAAGLPLPDFKAAENNKKSEMVDMLTVPNAAYGAYLRGSLQITEMAMKLRQSKNKGPVSGP